MEKRSVIITGTETKTIQNPAGRCDPRKAVQRAYQEGRIFGRSQEGMYVDLEQLPQNLAEMREKVEYYDKMFKRLSSPLKNKFNQSPEKLIEFLKDPKNLTEAAELGLLNPELRRKIMVEKRKIMNKIKRKNKEKEEKNAKNSGKNGE